MDTDKRGKSILEGTSSCAEKDCFHLHNIFPDGLRVLLINNDQSCLLKLRRMLESCSYKVTTCWRVEEALSMLWQDKNRFHMVISDLHMLDLDGFKLLEIIKKEMEVPVFILSADDKKEAIMKDAIQGACDYLVKPVDIDTIKLLWKHVIFKKMNGPGGLLQPGRVQDNLLQPKQSCDVDQQPPRSEGNRKSSKRGNVGKDEGEVTANIKIPKKPRISWNSDLHQKFVLAVKQLGHEAVPVKILECMERMGVQGLTRENISSHLQKYRLYLQKENKSLQERGSFRLSQESILKQTSSSDGYNVQTCVNSGQLARPSLTVPQAGGFERLNSNASFGWAFVDQRSLLNSRIPESNSIPIIDQTNFFNSGISGLSSMPVVDQKNLVDSRILESSYYPTYKVMNGFHYEGTPEACLSNKNESSGEISSSVEQFVCGDRGNIVQDSKFIPAADACDVKDDNISELIYDPLSSKLFDVDEFLLGSSHS